MPIIMPCPHCGESLTIPDMYDGRWGRCTHCRERVFAQEPEAAEKRPDFWESMELLSKSMHQLGCALTQLGCLILTLPFFLLAAYVLLSIAFNL